MAACTLSEKSREMAQADAFAPPVFCMDTPLSTKPGPEGMFLSIHISGCAKLVGSSAYGFSRMCPLRSVPWYRKTKRAGRGQPDHAAQPRKITRRTVATCLHPRSLIQP